MCKALDERRSTLLELCYVVVQTAPEPSGTVGNQDDGDRISKPDELMNSSCR